MTIGLSAILAKTNLKAPVSQSKSIALTSGSGAILLKDNSPLPKKIRQVTSTSPDAPSKKRAESSTQNQPVSLSAGLAPGLLSIAPAITNKIEEVKQDISQFPIDAPTLIKATIGGVAVAGTAYVANKAITSVGKAILANQISKEVSNMGLYNQIDAILGGVLPGGVSSKDYSLGGKYIGKRKKVNPLNYKALKKALVRVDRYTTANKMVEKRIRKLIPAHMKKKSSSHGVITRQEAEYALRR